MQYYVNNLSNKISVHPSFPFLALNNQKNNLFYSSMATLKQTTTETVSETITIMSLDPLCLSDMNLKGTPAFRDWTKHDYQIIGLFAIGTGLFTATACGLLGKILPFIGETGTPTHGEDSLSVPESDDSNLPTSSTNDNLSPESDSFDGKQNHSDDHGQETTDSDQNKKEANHRNYGSRFVPVIFIWLFLVKRI